MKDILEMAIKAREASKKLCIMGQSEKDKALKAMAAALNDNAENIIRANEQDILNARNAGIKESMIDRLMLDKKRITAMSAGLLKVAALNDPIGSVDEAWVRPNGIRIARRRVPIGVVGIIYEARPNVTADAIGLLIKTGNAAVLRGGKEAINSNVAITECMNKAAVEAGIPEGAINLVRNTSRESATYMMKLNGYIDVLIPRGGSGLIKSVVENATVPVIETGTGNCHAFVDESADLKMAQDIIINGKTTRVSVCNALENMLVHKSIAGEFLPIIVKALRDKNVEIRGCEKTKEIIPDVILATEDDFYKEFLDYIISVKIVDDIGEAISHINEHGTKHSETIITSDYANAKKFQDEIDAAAVYVNVSTRFTDGEEFGFGAEIGISTQKLHARGPMGLEALTSYKYVIDGNGQIR